MEEGERQRAKRRERELSRTNARSHSTNSSRSIRLSQIRSSRVIRIDNFESDTDIYKFFSNRASACQSRAMKASSFFLEVRPIPVQGIKRKSGYDLKFEVPPDGTSTNKQKERKQVQIPPLNLSLSAVRYSLNHKDCLTNARSWQGEAMLENEYVQDNFQRSISDRNVTYMGNLTHTGHSRGMYVQRDIDLNKLNSVFVFAPSVDSSQSALLWSWPWLNQNQDAFQTYQMIGDKILCIENQGLRLPKLEFPLQAQMLVRYLRTVKPCVTESTFQEAKKAVENFALKYGSEFHQILCERAIDSSSWIEANLPNLHHEFTWEEAPLFNLGIIAPYCHDLWPEHDNSLLQRACKVIQHVTEFWKLIITQKLKEIADDDGHPQCMSQFLKLFNSVKVPGLPSAAACSFFNISQSENIPQNIIVIYRGLIYSIDVVDENFDPLPNIQIEHSLQEILLFSNKSSFPSVGILTAANMGIWSLARGHLMRLSQENEACLMDIERAMFVLSLDHKSVRGLDMLAKESLFGDGFNRWYDKGLSIYIHNNGLVTLNVNRTLLDGPTVAHLLYFMHLRIKDDADEWDEKSSLSDGSLIFQSPSGSTRHLSNAEEIQMQAFQLEASARRSTWETKMSSLSATDAQALCFEIDDDIEQEIESCTNRFNFLSSLLITSVCKNDQVKEMFFTRHGIHKDAFAHMVLHLTYFKMYFKMASIGCKVSLLKFYNAGYDIFRSTTPEMADWCKAMLDPKIDEAQKKAFFLRAEKVHQNLLSDCYNGRGCDNYIHAMMQIAEELNLPSENMFDDEGFKLAGWGENYDIYAETMGVGCTSCPVVLPTSFGGYGVGYSVATSFVMFCVSSWKRESRTSADLFAASLNLNVRSMISSISQWTPEETANFNEAKS